MKALPCPCPRPVEDRPRTHRNAQVKAAGQPPSFPEPVPGLASAARPLGLEA